MHLGKKPLSTTVVKLIVLIYLADMSWACLRNGCDMLSDAKCKKCSEEGD